MKSDTTIEQLETYCEKLSERILTLEIAMESLKDSDLIIRFKNHLAEHDYVSPPEKNIERD